MNPRDQISEQAPWLLDPKLAVCVVGSSALAEACKRAGTKEPVTADLDLSWAVDIDRGSKLLQERGVEIQTTSANRERGTLAFRMKGERIEITSLRGGANEQDIQRRIEADLGYRDMTVGALAWWLTEDRVLDPFDGLSHWQDGRIVPVGEAAARIREHPVRWLRYYRRARQWEFDLDSAVRDLDLDPQLLTEVPSEALAAEFRAALLDVPSPGQYFAELYDAGLLPIIAPELAPQFDGRPAGPIRHHPEGGQGEHMILALRWARERSMSLPEADRVMLMLAVLCHDLGKGFTPAEKFPAHHGHERAGVLPLRKLLDKLPGLANPSSRRLAEEVCVLHLDSRRLRGLRPGTLARLYEQYFRKQDFRADLFALAVGADSGGRLGKSEEGDQVAAQIQDDLAWLQECCRAVDAASIRKKHADPEDFKRALYEARSESIAAARKT
ncbi:MAG: HD domain-containing protein [Planctomycetota bacterium]